jgi:hypothetical protein
MSVDGSQKSRALDMEFLAGRRVAQRARVYCAYAAPTAARVAAVRPSVDRRVTVFMAIGYRQWPEKLVSGESRHSAGPSSKQDTTAINETFMTSVALSAVMAFWGCFVDTCLAGRKIRPIDLSSVRLAFPNRLLNSRSCQ